MRTCSFTATLGSIIVVPVRPAVPPDHRARGGRRCACGGPGRAGEVILVDGDRAVRVNDPAVPTVVSLGMPIGGPGPVGIAATRSDREARAARRARSAWRRVRERPPTRNDRRAVYAALRRVQSRRAGGRLPTDGAGAPGSSGRSAPTGSCAELAARSSATCGSTRSRRWRCRSGWVRRACRRPSFSSSATGATGVAPLPGGRRPGQLQGQRDPLPVLPRRGPPAPPALDLQEGRPPVPRLPERLRELRRGGPPAPARRDDRTRRAPGRRSSSPGSSLPLRRRLAAVDQRAVAGAAFQAYAAGVLLPEPRYVETARAGLGAFEAGPPRGVRTRGPRGGVHYLEYYVSRRACTSSTGSCKP